MLHRAYAFALFIALMLNLMGCQTTGANSGKSPLPPTIGPLVVNGSIWPNEPLTVYFSTHVTQAESATTVGMNDLYFANPYAFQLQLAYQFPSLGFEIQQNGVTLPIMPARTNTKSRPSKVAPADVIDPATGQVIVRAGTVLEWDWPLPANMQPRNIPPKDKSSYSIEMINTCAGKPNLSGASCSSPGAILLLTISPPIQPANPVNGQVFDYTLIEKGSGNYSGTTASTNIKAIYVQPNQCQIRNLILQPSSGKVGDVATASFETTACRRVTLNVSSEQNALFDRVSPLYADNVMDSRKFVLPKSLSVSVKLTASDSMLRSVSRTGNISIDPCSISPTHAQCPVNCTANPNDSRCPVNCTAHPNDPRCVTACPRTTENPKGEYLPWETGMYCGNFQTIPVTIYGCTFAEASQSYPPQFGCVYTTIPGKPVGDCPSGIPKQDFDMCLSCTAQGSTTATTETALVRDVCSLDDAKKIAIDARKPRSCVFLSPGQCP